MRSMSRFTSLSSCCVAWIFSYKVRNNSRRSANNRWYSNIFLPQPYSTTRRSLNWDGFENQHEQLLVDSSVSTNNWRNRWIVSSRVERRLTNWRKNIVEQFLFVCRDRQFGDNFTHIHCNFAHGYMEEARENWEQNWSRTYQWNGWGWAPCSHQSRVQSPRSIKTAAVTATFTPVYDTKTHILRS